MIQVETIEVIVFDVNETLSDLTPLRDRFVQHGLAGHQAEAWFASVLRDGFALSTVQDSARFAQIAADLLGDLLSENDPDAEEQSNAVSDILGAFGSLPVHADVAGAVADLVAQGRTLITLSNGAAKVAETILGAAGLRDHFASILSVEDAGIWKPAPASYAYALDHGGWSPEQGLLVACHPWDLHGAHAAGMSTAWVNRAGRSWPSYFAEPDITVSDLGDLPDRLSDLG